MPAFTPTTLLTHQPPFAEAAATVSTAVSPTHTPYPTTTQHHSSAGSAAALRADRRSASGGPGPLEIHAVRALTSFAAGFLRAPLERVRLQQQAGEEGREGVQGREHIFIGGNVEGQVTGPPCAALLLSQTLRDEGSMGPWRAFWPSIAAVPVATLATQYAKPLSTLLPFDPSVHGTARFIGHYILVGSLSASIVALCTAPLNLASIHLAADVGRARYTDVLDVWRRVVSESGLMGLFRGFEASLAGIFVYRSAYYALRPLFLHWFAKSRFRALGLGVGLTLASSLVAYPLDMLRCRMIVGQPGRSAWTTAKAVYHEEGVRGFFRGVRVVLLQTTLSLLLFDPAVADLPSLYARLRFPLAA